MVIMYHTRSSLTGSNIFYSTLIRKRILFQSDPSISLSDLDSTFLLVVEMMQSDCQGLN